MHAFLVAGAALALSACGGGGDTRSNAVTTNAADNLTMDQNMMINPGMNGTGNMATDPAMANGTTNSLDPRTQNMIRQDMNTNDPDTNLANGM